MRTPTNASTSNFENDGDRPPSTSKAKAKSFFEEKGWTPSIIMRGLSVLLASVMVLSVSYGSIVSGAEAISSGTHENVRRRQATDSDDTQCTSPELKTVK